MIGVSIGASIGFLAPDRAREGQGAAFQRPVPKRTCTGDCARFTHASHSPWSDVAFSSPERDRHLGIRPVSQLNTWPVVSPVNASRLPSRTESPASLGVTAGWALPHRGLSPLILCQLVLAHSVAGHFTGNGVALLCTSDCPAHGTAACGAFFSSNRLLSQVGGKHQSSRFESGKRWVSL